MTFLRTDDCFTMRQELCPLVDVVCRLFGMKKELLSRCSHGRVRDTQEVDEMKMEGAMPEEELAEEAEGLGAVIHITQNT